MPTIRPWMNLFLISGCILMPLFACAQTLSGAVLYAADAAGGYNGYDHWTTGGPSAKLFLKQGSAWLNAPDGKINIPLSPGLHTFKFYIQHRYSYNPLGLNLFFDGDTKSPDISAVTLAAKTKDEKPPFAQSRGKSMGIDAKVIPEAATLVYTRNDKVVELIGFRFQDPSV